MACINKQIKKKGWAPYDQNSKKILEAGFNRYHLEDEDEVIQSQFIKLLNPKLGFPYQIDFLKMEQKNCMTGEQGL